MEVYVVHSREIYGLGESVLFQGRNLVIGKVVSRLEGSELCHIYHLTAKNNGLIPRRQHDGIRGFSLKATVSQVEKDMVQVEILEDENKERSGKRWFSYSTVYSTPDGTGWYCMPEPGDQVRLTFSDHEESSAYVSSSVHLGTSGGRSNPAEKSWKNKQNKEVLFTPDSLILQNNDGLSLELLDKEGIRIRSDKGITIQSGKEIQMNSQNGGIHLEAETDLTLTQGSAGIRLADDIKISGGKIFMN